MIRQSAAVTFRPELSNAEYHAELEHDSNSSLSLFRKSPPKYYHQRITKRIPLDKDTPAKQMGSAIHTAVLEPEKFDSVIVEIPADVLNADGHKKGNDWKVWSWNNRGRIQLTKAEIDEIRWMVDGVWGNPAARDLLKACTAFESTVMVDGEDPRKCRFDAVAEIDSFYADLKSHCFEDELEFWRSVQQFGYHRQAALYSDIFHNAYGSKPKCKLILVSKECPDDVVVRTMPAAAVEVGHIENREAFAGLRKCRASGVWLREGAHEERELFLPEFFYG